MKYDNRKKADKLTRSRAAEYLTYVAAAGQNGVEPRYEDENIWLTQKMLSVLYGVSTSAINQHIKKIYEDKESDKCMSCADMSGNRAFRMWKNRSSI